MLSRIYDICKRYTDLTNEEIAKIQTMSSTLKAVANIEQADVFIDCMIKDSKLAIVVCQERSDETPSSYKGSVVGMYATEENEPSVFRSLSLGVGTKHVKAITQEHVNVVQTVEPIKSKNKVIGVLIIEKRITDENNLPAYTDHIMEDIVNDNNWLTKYIDLAIVMVDKKGAVCYRNTIANALYKKLGYVDDILGMPYQNILLHSSMLSSLDSTKPCSNVEVSVRNMVLNVKQILLNQKDVSFVTIIRDVTKIYENEKQLVLKSVAIKEMHHRIKNNLQMIASVLNMEVRRAKSQEIKDVLQDTINRVLAISTTHELLLKRTDDEVNIRELIQNIIDNIMNYSDKFQKVKIKVLIDDFNVHSDISSSVAMVVNELLQNSIKHAFNNKLQGNISVRIQHEKSICKVYVDDDGDGFDVEKINPKGLGISIVQAVVKDKLHGNFTIKSSSSGTKVCFDFKNQAIHTVDPMQG